jgi:hypothetical protein
MRRCRGLRVVLAAVLARALFSGFMMLVGRCDDCFARRLFDLPDSHRSAALNGQHRDRKPKQETEKRAHDSAVVPQIKNAHQGTAFGTLLV